MRNLFHFYRYHRNFAVGIGCEHTFNGYYAVRFGLGFWCFSITWKDFTVVAEPTGDHP